MKAPNRPDRPLSAVTPPKTPDPSTPAPGAPSGTWVRVQPWEQLALKPGESVEGIFLGVRELDGPHGKFTSLGLRTAGGRRYYTTHTMAVQLVRENLVSPGERIRLTFLDFDTSGAKGAYARYVLDLWQEGGDS